MTCERTGEYICQQSEHLMERDVLPGAAYDRDDEKHKLETDRRQRPAGILTIPVPSRAESR